MVRRTHEGSNTQPDHDRNALPAAVFGRIAERMRDAVCLQDMQGRVEWMNPACEEMFGWTLQQARGRKAVDFISLPGKRNLGADNNVFTYDPDSRIFVDPVVTEFQRRDRSRFWVQQSFSMIEDGGDPEGSKIIVTCRDMTEQVKTEQKLRQAHSNMSFAATHDSLTKLANRTKLDQFLRAKDVAAAIDAATLGIVQLDIHKFKDINDTLGHAAGDATLRHIADALRRNCQRNELACRIGGDEFLLVCLGCDTETDLTQRAQSLLDDANEPMSWEGRQLKAEVSIGASLAIPGGTSGEELLQQANKALCIAKRNARGKIAIYQEDMGRKYHADMTQMDEIRTALTEGQFEIYLQPQVGLGDATVIGFETLIRWNHPEKGVLNPGQFLPNTEAAGLSADLDYVAMNLSLDAMAVLRAQGFGGLHFSLNVSSSILGDVNYPGLLDWAMQSRDIDPATICIEILETTILDGGGVEIATAIDRLKRLGVRISLDDFGTGYAGLAHMSSFDVDEIKLDRSMISRLAQDPRNRMIVRSIIRLCDILGIGVVAEGVETNHQLEILRRARCPLIQGFGVARPMPVAHAIDWLHATTPIQPPLRFDNPPRADIVPLSATGSAAGQ